MGNSVTRKEFIQAFMAQGMGYVDACRAYEAMCETFARAVRQGSKIGIGRVMSLLPVIKEPCLVNMRFSKTKKGIEPAHRQYYLGRRLRFKVNIYREFVAKNRISV